MDILFIRYNSINNINKQGGVAMESQEMLDKIMKGIFGLLFLSGFLAGFWRDNIKMIVAFGILMIWIKL